MSGYWPLGPGTEACTRVVHRRYPGGYQQTMDASRAPRCAAAPCHGGLAPHADDWDLEAPGELDVPLDVGVHQGFLAPVVVKLLELAAHAQGLLVVVRGDRVGHEHHVGADRLSDGAALGQVTVVPGLGVLPAAAQELVYRLADGSAMASHSATSTAPHALSGVRPPERSASSSSYQWPPGLSNPGKPNRRMTPCRRRIVYRLSPSSLLAQQQPLLPRTAEAM